MELACEIGDVTASLKADEQATIALLAVGRLRLECNLETLTYMHAIQSDILHGVSAAFVTPLAKMVAERAPPSPPPPSPLARPFAMLVSWDGLHASINATRLQPAGVQFIIFPCSLRLASDGVATDVCTLAFVSSLAFESAAFKAAASSASLQILLRTRASIGNEWTDKEQDSISRFETDVCVRFHTVSGLGVHLRGPFFNFRPDLFPMALAYTLETKSYLHVWGAALLARPIEEVVSFPGQSRQQITSERYYDPLDEGPRGLLPALSIDVQVDNFSSQMSVPGKHINHSLVGFVSLLFIKE
jgi:hypothetical protein